MESLPDDKFLLLRQNILMYCSGKRDTEEEENTNLINAYNHCAAFCISINRDYKMVPLDQFTKDVNRDQFFETLTKARKEPPSLKDVKDVVFCGMCFYFGINHVVNVI